MHFPISEMQVVSESKIRTRESMKLFILHLSKPSLGLIKPSLIEGLGHKRWQSASNGIDVLVSFRSCCSHSRRKQAHLQQQLKGAREEEKTAVLAGGKQIRTKNKHSGNGFNSPPELWCAQQNERKDICGAPTTVVSLLPPSQSLVPYLSLTWEIRGETAQL